VIKDIKMYRMRKSFRHSTQFHHIDPKQFAGPMPLMKTAAVIEARLEYAFSEMVLRTYKSKIFPLIILSNSIYWKGTEYKEITGTVRKTVQWKLHCILPE